MNIIIYLLEECSTLWGASDEYAEIVYFGREVGVIIIEDMILKMLVKNLGKNGMRRLIGGLRIQSVPSNLL